MKGMTGNTSNLKYLDYYLLYLDNYVTETITAKDIHCMYITCNAYFSGNLLFLLFKKTNILKVFLESFVLQNNILWP